MDTKNEKEFAKWLENQNEEKDLKKKKKEKNKKLFIGFIIFILIFGFISAIFETDSSIDYGLSKCECYKLIDDRDIYGNLQSPSQVEAKGYSATADAMRWCYSNYGAEKMMECY